MRKGAWLRELVLIKDGEAAAFQFNRAVDASKVAYGALLAFP